MLFFQLNDTFEETQFSKVCKVKSFTSRDRDPRCVIKKKIFIDPSTFISLQILSTEKFENIAFQAK